MSEPVDKDNLLSEFQVKRLNIRQALCFDFLNNLLNYVMKETQKFLGNYYKIFIKFRPKYHRNNHADFGF